MTMKIYKLRKPEQGTFYVIIDGRPQPVNPDHCTERLEFRRREDGSYLLEQSVDTPFGVVSFPELYLKVHGSILKRAPLDDCTEGLHLRIKRPDGGSVACTLSVEGGKPRLSSYWKVDAFGCVDRDTEVWHDEIFQRNPAYFNTWESRESDRWSRVYETVREASYYNDAFGGTTWHDMLKLSPEAAGDIRAAIRGLREALERHKVRMVYDQDECEVKFIGDPKLDGWSERTDCDEPSETESYVEIPDSEFRSLGFPATNWKNDSTYTFIVKDKEVKE